MDNFSDFQFQTQRFKNNIKTLPKKDQEFINRAYKLAKKQHKNQKRRDGTPYLIHCLRITSDLMERRGISDKNVLAASLLHDTVEDTDITINEISKKFGEKVAKIVSDLTRDTRFETEENKYELKLKKHKETLNKSFDTRLIKALDHLDNANSRLLYPRNSSEEKRFKRWIKETETIHIPMAETVDKDVANRIKDILVSAKKRLDINH